MSTVCTDLSYDTWFISIVTPYNMSSMCKPVLSGAMRGLACEIWPRFTALLIAGTITNTNVSLTTGGEGDIDVCSRQKQRIKVFVGDKVRQKRNQTVPVSSW